MEMSKLSPELFQGCLSESPELKLDKAALVTGAALHPPAALSTHRCSPQALATQSELFLPRMTVPQNVHGAAWFSLDLNFVKAHSALR